MRIVRHIGARTIDSGDADTMTPLVAMPVLRGERLAFLNAEFFACEQADEPPEQPRIVTFEIGYVPGLIMQPQAITTASLAASYAATLSGVSGGSEWAPDPNPGADEANWMEPNLASVLGGRKLWAHNGLTRAIGVGMTGYTEVSGTGTATNIEGKHVESATARLRGGYFQDTGVIMCVVNNPTATAQTDFGVAEMDDQSTIEELFDALNDGNVAANSDAAKMQELLFGGDQYIEADTLKVFAGRVYCRVTAGFTGIEKVSRRLRR